MKVCVITGGRADYGILYPVMKRIEITDGLELQIIATCMHLMEEFGHTVDEIERDGFSVSERVDISYSEDSTDAVSRSVGNAIVRLTDALVRLGPDVIVILGDRGEVLAAAVAGNYLGIPVAHIHGGEVSGHVDGVLRHAITKLSHLHFAATEKSAERIIKMGELPQRVFLVGAPALDRILGSDWMSDEELHEKYSLDSRDGLVIVIQHPVSGQEEDAAEQMRETMEVVAELGRHTIVIYPNADAGGRGMISVIKEYQKDGLIEGFESMPHKDYLGLMRIADVLVGNSSSGIIEAPSFHLPVVNIGIRQEGRERSVNVLDVDHDRSAIKGAMEKALSDDVFRSEVRRCVNPYGDGHASERIVEVLTQIKETGDLFNKRMAY